MSAPLPLGGAIGCPVHAQLARTRPTRGPAAPPGLLTTTDPLQVHIVSSRGAAKQPGKPRVAAGSPRAAVRSAPVVAAGAAIGRAGWRGGTCPVCEEAQCSSRAGGQANVPCCPRGVCSGFRAASSDFRIRDRPLLTSRGSDAHGSQIRGNTVAEGYPRPRDVRLKTGPTMGDPYRTLK